MESITRFLEKRLKLKVNRKKSAVGHPTVRKFLGFTFMILGYGVDITISRQSLKRFKDRIRKITNPSWPIPTEERVKLLNRYLRGWLGYYALTDSPSVLGALSGWIRRRMRLCIWQQWKRPRTKVRKLISLGVDKDLAYMAGNSSKKDWQMTKMLSIQKALNNSFWENLGLIDLLKLYPKLRQGW